MKIRPVGAVLFRANSCFSQFSNAPKKKCNLSIQQNSFNQSSDNLEILTIYHSRSVVLRPRFLPDVTCGTHIIFLIVSWVIWMLNLGHKPSLSARYFYILSEPWRGSHRLFGATVNSNASVL